MLNRGIARLEVQLRQGRSIVTSQYGQAPLQLHRPLYLEGKDFPTVYLRTPSAGLLAGDIHDLQIRVGAGCTLELRTQAATLVYPGSSQQRIRAVVEAGGHLIFRPHPLILASGADLNQKVTIDLAESACLQYEERWCAGRIAMGEQWKFARFTNCLEISVADVLAYRERWVLEPAHLPVTHPLICGNYVQFSSLYCFGLDLPISTGIPESQLSWSLVKGNGQVCRWVC